MTLDDIFKPTGTSPYDYNPDPLERHWENCTGGGDYYSPRDNRAYSDARKTLPPEPTPEDYAAAIEHYEQLKPTYTVVGLEAYDAYHGRYKRTGAHEVLTPEEAKHADEFETLLAATENPFK